MKRHTPISGVDLLSDSKVRGSSSLISMFYINKEANTMLSNINILPIAGKLKAW